jgi:ESS family glutamate:Na+ symporter
VVVKVGRAVVVGGAVPLLAVVTVVLLVVFAVVVTCVVPVGVLGDGFLVVNTVVQIALSVFVAVRVLFRLLGRDYDAAVTVGGFLGFGLSSMPVAMATMDQLTNRWGPSPRAFLLITLCGSIFVDLVNTLVIKGFLALPLFFPVG